MIISIKKTKYFCIYGLLSLSLPFLDSSTILYGSLKSQLYRLLERSVSLGKKSNGIHDDK